MKGLKFWQWGTSRWALLTGDKDRMNRTWVKEHYLPFRGWTRK
jgi:hypothetical protein